jgi:hypothetical protein
MRSIRVRRVHPLFVVETFFERARAEIRVGKRGHFCRARAHIPRLETSTEIEAGGTTLTTGRIVQISGVHIAFIGTQIEEEAQY